MHAIFQHLSKGNLIFDIGANAGNKTEQFLSKLARVIAVEPQPNMVDGLRHRFGDNKNVTIIPKGLSYEPGKLVMQICSTDSPLSTFNVDWKESGRFSHAPWDLEEEIEITTLDILIKEYGKPRYAKIDVEGFEKKVVLGLSSKQIDIISLEFMNESLSETFDALWYTAGLGYNRFNFSAGESSDFMLSEWANIFDVVVALKKFCADTHQAWGDVYIM